MRVAEVAAEPGAPVVVPPAAGEVRIAGVPADSSAAAARIKEVVAASHSVPVSGFSLADLEQLAGRERVTLRALLEQLRAAGLELVAEAPFDQLRDRRRSIEEVNIAGLGLARLTIHQLPSSEVPELLNDVSMLQQDVGVIRAFAPLPRRVNPAVPTTGYDDVKRVALARLFVDEHSFDPGRLGALRSETGAGGAHRRGGRRRWRVRGGRRRTGPRRAPLEEIRRNIQAAGLEPVERDGRFDRRVR